MERRSCFWTAAESGVQVKRNMSLEEATPFEIVSEDRLFEAGLNSEADPTFRGAPAGRGFAAPRGAILRRPSGTQHATANQDWTNDLDCAQSNWHSAGK